MAHFCTKCGNEIKPGSKFCNKCGTPVKTQDIVANIPNKKINNVSAQIGKKNSTGISKTSAIALVVAGLLIGVGGYVLFGRSSEDKKLMAQSKPIQTQQTSKLKESTLAPKPMEKQKPAVSPIQQFRVDQSSATNAFISFHGAITNRQLADAYNILSPQYQKFMRSYENFARGYVTTLSSKVVELNTVREDSNSATYTYKLKAVDREGNGTKTQYFAGKATLIRINGRWRLDSTEAKRL